MPDIKSRLLQIIPIESYIGRFVPLKKQGRNFVGLCPFHKEKTPSFTVSPEKGLFYCFGCGKGGNLITFVMEKEKVSFREALKILCQYAGIPCEEEKQDTELKLLEKILREYRNFLYSSEGKKYYDYLIQRGIKEHSLVKFQLGAAPNSNIVAGNFSGEMELLLQLGLVRKSENQYHDFFRNRVIFPIFDFGGRVVGFGGRVIDDTTPKYLNSPESKVFHKGSSLYGIPFSLDAIKKKSQVIITEGYLDVIGLHQMGLENAVAPLGTAFTDNHFRILQRFAGEFVIMMDGDAAGRKATIRILLAHQENIEKMKVFLMPEGMDPFDFSQYIQRHGPDSFQDFQEFLVSGMEYIFFNLFFDDTGLLQLKPEDNPYSWLQEIKKNINKDRWKQVYENYSLQEKEFLLRRVKEFLPELRDDTLKGLFLQEWKSITGIALPPTVAGSKLEKENVEKQKYKEKKIDARDEIFFHVEKNIIGILIKHPEMVSRFAERINTLEFVSPEFALIWRYLYEKLVLLNWDADTMQLVTYLDEELRNVLTSLLFEEKNLLPSLNKFAIDDDYAIENILNELLIRHRLLAVEREIEEKQEKLKFMNETEAFHVSQQLRSLMDSKKNLLKFLKGN